MREADALQQARLPDCRVHPLTSTAALLFEMRTSLRFDDGNAALLVVRGLRSFDRSTPAAARPLLALTVLAGTPGRTGGSFPMEFGPYPDAKLTVAGDLAEFYVLDAEGTGDVPPDHPDMEPVRVQHALPSWPSMCDLLQASGAP
ncbi:hypothetical protein J0910_18065 [Nocardiopsis sp. CNT-189]|uniref:hypothetical protein n=1 Tax=Nocardiopsis oceanisediminis TaxID=2816862 RepID=UPI003B31DAA6